MGGIIGINGKLGKIHNCYNSGNVTASEKNGSYNVVGVGGVVGHVARKGLVKHSYNTGTISSTSTGVYTGGVAGSNEAWNGSAQVLENASTIQYSYNSGNVNSKGTKIGGLTGWNANYCYIKDSYSSSSAVIKYNSTSASSNIGSSSSYLGKIIGYAASTSSTYISNYNTLAAENMPSVYNVVNGLNDGESQIWAKDELKEGSTTEYKYNNNGNPILKWEIESM